MRSSHLLLMVVINLAWGLNFIAAKYAIDEMPPLFATGLRFVLVFVLLLPFLKIVKGKMKHLISAALIIGALHFSILYYAISVADNISSVAIVTLTNVPFATLLAVIFLGERIGIFSIAGLVLAFAGVMILGFDPGALEHMEDLLLVMLAAFIYAVGAIMLRRLAGVHVLNLQCWIGLLGMISVLSLSYFVENGQLAAIEAASWRAKGSVIFSAVASSIIGHGGIYYLLKRYPVTTIAPLTLMSQVFAVIASVILLGEILTLKMWIGGLLTFIGVGVIVFRKRRKTVDANPALPETE